MYQNGQALTTQVCINFYPPQWEGAGIVIPYTFECMGIVKRTSRNATELRFTVHGAVTERHIPSIRGHYSKGLITEPLQQALAEKLQIAVTPIKATVIEGGQIEC